MKSGNKKQQRVTSLETECCTWISSRFENYLTDLERNQIAGSASEPIDFLILGSGYGAAVAAQKLARNYPDNTRKVVLFERGDEYLPGSFPEAIADLPGHLRISPVAKTQVVGNKHGLFDMRIGNQLNCLIANGLGGGSLINAGVMRRPPAHAYETEWPDAITQTVLEPYLTRSEVLLGSHTRDTTTDSNVPVTVNLDTDTESHSKTRLLQQSVNRLRAGNPNSTFAFEPAAITVAVNDGENQSGVELSKCINCADCATGCNHNAKNSLDVNLLVEAYRDGATLITGVTALKLVKHTLNNNKDNSTGNSTSDSTLWQVDCRFTDDRLFERDTGGTAGIRSVYAHNVLVCCGALGSTELLLNSQTDTLAFSHKLGHNFSGNGDLLAFYPTDHFKSSGIRPNSSARPHVPPAERHIGPTIGGVVSTTGTKDSGLQTLLIEEMAIPGTIRSFFEQPIELNRYIRGVLTNFQKRLTDDEKIHPLAVDNTGIYAAIGDDQSKGIVSLPQEGNLKNPQAQHDGIAQVSWSDFNTIEKLFNEQTRRINELFAEKPNRRGVLPNPMWRFFKRLQRLLTDENRLNTALSVHPLGGCRMADSVSQGVTDDKGRVFNPQTNQGVHDGLYVLDGAIVPRALSANPALTITALALRATEQLVDEQLFNLPDLHTSDTAIAPQLLSSNPSIDNSIATHGRRKLPSQRPRINKHENQLATNARSQSRFTLLERLGGEVTLKIKGVKHTVFLELTIRSAAKNLNEFSDADYRSNSEHEQFQVSANWSHKGFSSTLRIYPSRAAYDDAERRAMVQLPMLSDNDFGSSWQGDRSLFGALISNQSAREKILTEAALTVISLEGSVRVLHTKPYAFFRRAKTGVKNIIKLGFLVWQTRSFRLALATTQWRYLTYRLLPAQAIYRTDADSKTQALVDRLQHRIRKSIARGETLLIGEKCVYTDRPETIISQLSEVNIRKFPFFSRLESERLVLDPKLFAATAHPLIAIEKQTNLIDSFTDLASFSLFCFKRLLPIHAPAIAAAAADIFATSAATQTDELTAPADVKRTPGEIPGANRTLYLLEVPKTISSPDSNSKTSGRLNIHPSDDTSPVFIGLTRYQGKHHEQVNTTHQRAPILLIHGYIAGGNTFTHHSLEYPLAQTLIEDGYDVWVLDMRDSCRFYAQAQKIWTFEQVGLIDIRVAIDFVCKTSRQPAIEVLAHCIGSAKFSLAMLSDKASIQVFEYEAKQVRDWSVHDWEPRPRAPAGHADSTQYSESTWQRYTIDATHPAERIAKAVLSQVTPILSVSDGNLLRAYLLDNWLKFTPFSAYQLQYRRDNSGFALMAEKLLDAGLQMIPYAYDKSDKRLDATEFKEAMRIRRRMDLLYNKVFELKHTSDKTLHHLHELFGPVNLHTLLQGVHFARESQVTGHLGEGVSYRNNRILERMAEQWTFPTLCFIGADNNVFHADGFQAFKQAVDVNELTNFHVMTPINDYGHQDAFTGTKAHTEIHPLILAWLDNPISVPGDTQHRKNLNKKAQRKFISVTQQVSHNIQPIADGLALTLRKSDLPRGVSTVRLANRAHPQPAVFDYRYLQQSTYTDNFADISHDKASVYFLIKRNKANDLFTDSGRIAAIDIQVDALHFSSPVTE